MMASLATHLVAFLFLFPIGFRRLLRTSSLYLKNPSLFRSKSWYFSDRKCNNLDFYLLLAALPIASFSEFFLFIAFSGHPTYDFAFLQQSATIFLFWLLLILIVVRENLDPFLVTDSFVFIFAGIAFLADYSVIGKGVKGIGGAVYGWLGELSLLCAGSCLYLSVRPSAFFADFLLSSGLVFKGTWVLQAGLSLYTDAFGLKGCQKLSLLPDQDQADMACDLEEDGLRGVAVMGFIFTLHAMLVLVLNLVVFGFLTSNRNLRGGEARGQLLAQLDSETSHVRPASEFEI